MRLRTRQRLEESVDMVRHDAIRDEPKDLAVAMIQTRTNHRADFGHCQKRGISVLVQVSVVPFEELTVSFSGRTASVVVLALALLKCAGPVFSKLPQHMDWDGACESERNEVNCARYIPMREMAACTRLVCHVRLLLPTT